MRVSYSTLVKAKRAGRATSVRVSPNGAAVTEYQVPLGNRHSLREAGVIGLPSWSDRATRDETWVRVPRLSALCPRRVVAYDGGRGDIDRCMEFGDEFDGIALDVAKWTPTNAGYTVANGTITITTSDATQRSMVSSATFPADRAMRVRKKQSLSGADNYHQLGFRSAETNAAITDVFTGFVGQYFNKLYTSSGSGTLNPTNLGYDTNYHNWDLIRNGTASVVMKYDGTAVTNTANLPVGSLPLYSNVIRASSGTVTAEIDWILVRKYVPNEPLAGTAQPSATNRALCRPLSHADLMRACCT